MLDLTINNFIIEPCFIPFPLWLSTLLGNMPLPFAIVTNNSPLFPRVASTCSRYRIPGCDNIKLRMTSRLLIASINHPLSGTLEQLDLILLAKNSIVDVGVPTEKTIWVKHDVDVASSEVCNEIDG
ncbi:hypothetical protein Tco_0935501 [Tanacetum coccineum]